MSILTNNLTNSTIPVDGHGSEQIIDMAEVVDVVKRISPPVDYYTGIHTTISGVPNNVLVFCRKHIRDLVGEGHVHQRYVMIIPLDTTGTVIVDSKAHYLSPGHAIVVFPYQFHYYTDLVQNTLMWLFITFELNDGESIRVLKDSPRQVRNTFWYDLKQICSQYSHLQSGQKETDNNIHLRTAILIHSMIGSSRLRTRSDTTAGSTSGKIDLLAAVGQYVFSRINKPISVTELARHLNMSPSNLRNHFRKRYKMGVAYYIRHTKMLQAMRMLRFTRLTITEIAEECGYPSVYSFSRSFKQETGQSPRMYRNME